jgi:hypothetical protein
MVWKGTFLCPNSGASTLLILFYGRATPIILFSGALCVIHLGGSIVDGTVNCLTTWCFGYECTNLSVIRIGFHGAKFSSLGLLLVDNVQILCIEQPIASLSSINYHIIGLHR